MSHSENLGRIADDEAEVKDGRSRRRFLLVIGLMVGIMLAAVIYVKAGDTVGVGESVFPQLAEAPPIGRIVSVDGQGIPKSQAARIGEDAPDFTFIDATGATRKLSDYKGQAVMINFWASWCPPCVKEMPDIEAIYRENQAKGLVVLGINLDDEPDAARKFLQLRGVTFPSISDGNQIAIYLYRVSPIPASFFIDRDGILRDMQVGAMTKSMIKNKIDKIL